MCYLKYFWLMRIAAENKTKYLLLIWITKFSYDILLLQIRGNIAHCRISWYTKTVIQYQTYGYFSLSLKHSIILHYHILPSIRCIIV